MTVLLLGALFVVILWLESESHPWKPPPCIAFLDTCDAPINGALLLLWGEKDEDHTYGAC